MLYNNLNFVLRLNKTRALNLNVGSYQIVETNENDLTAVWGTSYTTGHYG